MAMEVERWWEKAIKPTVVEVSTKGWRRRDELGSSASAAVPLDNLQNAALCGYRRRRKSERCRWLWQ